MSLAWLSNDFCFSLGVQNMTWRFTWKPAWRTESLRQVPNGFRYRVEMVNACNRKRARTITIEVCINPQQRICWVSISGGGEWWRENARPEKPEQPWNLAGTLLAALLEPCWIFVGRLLELCWNLPGTFWNLLGTCAGTLPEPSLEPYVETSWNVPELLLEPHWNHVETFVFPLWLRSGA